MAEEFAQHKPPLKVLVIGHEGHGKSTLIAALKHVPPLGSAAPPPKGKGAWGRFSAAIGQAFSGNAGAQEFAPAPVAASPQHGQGLDAQAFEFLDAPASSIPALIAKTAWTGDARIVLIVSVTDGPMPQTRDHLQLAKQAGSSQDPWAKTVLELSAALGG